MAKLAALLAAKIKSSGLNLTQAAKKAKISLPSFRGIVAGDAVPNDRTIAKYAKFLGISAEAIVDAGGTRTRTTKAAKAAKPVAKPVAKKAKKAKK